MTDSREKAKSLLFKGLIAGIFQIVLIATVLLVPAGTWYWPRALQFLCMYTIVVSVTVVLMARIAPASLAARLERPIAKSQPLADRFISPLLGLAVLGWLAFIPVDVFYLRIFFPPAFLVSILGAFIGIIGIYGVIAAMFQNAFIVSIVRVQPERNQVPIDTGLYGLIRHPFYLGCLLFLVGLALWLESYGSLIMLPVVIALLVARILVEEKTLRIELAGYIGYTEKVGYRLIPLIW